MPGRTSAPAACEIRKETVNYCLLVLTFLWSFQSLCLTPYSESALGALQPERDSEIKHSPSASRASPSAPCNLKGCLSATSSEGAPVLGKTAEAWRGPSDPKRHSGFATSWDFPSCVQRRPKALGQAEPEPAPRTRVPRTPARPRQFTKQTFPRVASTWNGARSTPINT